MLHRPVQLQPAEDNREAVHTLLRTVAHRCHVSVLGIDQRAHDGAVGGVLANAPQFGGHAD